jgi:hypothetical protein
VLALALEPEALVDGAATLLDELDPPLLQAASSVIAAAPASPVMASRFRRSLCDLPFDNIWGTPSFHLSSSFVAVRVAGSSVLTASGVSD